MVTLSSWHETRAIGRAARDAGIGSHCAMSGSEGDLPNLESHQCAAARGGKNPLTEPVYEQRTSSAADRMQAAADRAAREQRAATAAS